MKKFSTLITILITVITVACSVIVMKYFEQNTIRQTLAETNAQEYEYIIEESMQTEQDMRMPWETVDISKCSEVPLNEIQLSVIREICKVHDWRGDIGETAYYDKGENLYLCYPKTGQGYVIAFSPGMEGVRYSGCFAYSFGMIDTAMDKIEESKVTESAMERNIRQFEEYCYENLWYAHLLEVESGIYSDSVLFDQLYIGNENLNKEMFAELVKETDWMKESYNYQYFYRQKYYIEIRNGKHNGYMLAEYDKEKKDFLGFSIMEMSK